ncbi:hypothetical protein M9458_015400, partial [Cirrhinus mrigala]
VPTTSDSTHPQLVSSSSSSSSHNACTSESPQEGPGPSSSCSAAAPDSTLAAQNHGGVPGPSTTNTTATEDDSRRSLSGENGGVAMPSTPLAAGHLQGTSPWGTPTQGACRVGRHSSLVPSSLAPMVTRTTSTITTTPPRPTAMPAPCGGVSSSNQYHDQ